MHPGSQILYDGEWYPYLFYDAEITGLDYSSFEHGWVIQSIDDTWQVNGDPIEDLEGFFHMSLLELGLFENEVVDFVDYWFGDLDLFAEEGTYILRQIPLDVINKNFILQTRHSYEITRIMFTFNYFPVVESFSSLLSPEPMTVDSNSTYILHEWGLVF